MIEEKEKIIEELKQEAKKSWSGNIGEERAIELEKHLRAILKNYSEKTNLSELEILKGLENQRTYSAINFYQAANQPLIKEDNVIIANDKEHFLKMFPSKKFICPNCKGISTDPQECNSGIKLKLINGKGKKEICNWASYGLFGTLGKGRKIFLKDKIKIFEIFKPLELNKVE